LHRADIRPSTSARASVRAVRAGARELGRWVCGNPRLEGPRREALRPICGRPPRPRRTVAPGTPPAGPPRAAPASPRPQAAAVCECRSPA